MLCVNINTISANNYGTPVHLCKLSLLWLKKMATIIFLAGVWALNFYYDREIRVFPFHGRLFWLQLMKTSGFINNNILQESISTCVKSHYMLQVSSEIFVLHRVSVMPNDYIPFHSKIINSVIYCSYSDVYVFFYGLNAISYCCFYCGDMMKQMLEYPPLIADLARTAYTRVSCFGQTHIPMQCLPLQMNLHCLTVLCTHNSIIICWSYLNGCQSDKSYFLNSHISHSSSIRLKLTTQLADFICYKENEYMGLHDAICVKRALQVWFYWTLICSNSSWVGLYLTSLALLVKTVLKEQETHIKLKQYGKWGLVQLTG